MDEIDIVFAVSSVETATSLMLELKLHERIRVAGSFENGKCLVTAVCPPDDRVIWDVRATVKVFDEAAQEL